MESKTNLDVLTTRAADGIAVITLGSAKRIYFDAEMGDALTEALDGFAGDPNFRVVIVTGASASLHSRACVPMKGRRSPRRPAASRSKKGETYG
jgi:enoyl-CoA hydratase/carnithine racemase